MRVMAIIASVILIIFPTASFILGLVAGKRKAHTKREFVIAELIPGIVMYIGTLVIYWFAGVFKNFGL